MNLTSFTPMSHLGTVEREVQLRNGLHSSSTDAKITKAAKDFESLLIGNWLQHAEDSFAQAPGADADDSDDSTAQMQLSSAMQPLSKALTDAGGIGIAAMIEKQLQRASSPVLADELAKHLDTKILFRSKFNSP